MTAPPDPSKLSHAEKDARIAALEARIDELTRPPKTPQNSSIPPSRGHKANSAPTNRKTRKGHPGAARALHPNPTRHCDVPATQCQHCQADVSSVPQAAAQSYDRIELPELKPDVTRVILHGGVCPCCARRFKAECSHRKALSRDLRLAPTCRPSCFICSIPACAADRNRKPA